MSLKRGLALFVLIVAAACAFVLAKSIDASTLEQLKHVHKGRFLVIPLLMALNWTFDTGKLYALLRAARERVPFKLCYLIVWINYFGAAITPMQSGGGPFQVYMLYKYGVAVGKSVAVTLVRTLFTLLILGLALPISLFVDPAVLAEHSMMKGLMFYIVVFILAIWIVVFISLARPYLMKRWIGMLAMLLKRIGIIKSKHVRRIVRLAYHEIDNYNENIRLFLTEGRGYFALSFVMAVLQMAATLSIMPCLIWAFGYPVSFMHTVLLQAVLLFMLYFVPTPGGSGVAEGGATAVLTQFVPWSMAGVLGVLWRVLAEYSGVLLGIVAVLKLIGWHTAEDVLRHEPPEIDGVDR